MSENAKFTVESPRGYEVTCTEETWQHITEHGAMIGNEQAVIDAIKNPYAVFPSKSHPEKREVYFGTGTNTSYKTPYTKVVVEKQTENTYTTVTAFPAKKLDGNIQGGEVLYVRRQP